MMEKPFWQQLPSYDKVMGKLCLHPLLQSVWVWALPVLYLEASGFGARICLPYLVAGVFHQMLIFI